MERLRLRQAVVVEGKYDKIRLESLLDALILPTNGFQIYRDREMQALIRRLGASRGIVALTDSDAAGFRIRGLLAGMLPAEQLTHVFIPDRPGKERRKRAPSAEGKLGVEGIDGETLRRAFAQAGVLEDAAPPEDPITSLDLYEAGLSGGAGSRELRRELYRRLELPARVSARMALPLLNALLTRQAFHALMEELRREREI